VGTSIVMTARELSRQRVTLALALLLPAVFFAVVLAATRPHDVPVVLAAAGDLALVVDARRLSLLFISIAAAGLISAFIAASLVQRQREVSRRLVLCGYRATELLAARLVILLAIVAAAAGYTWIGLVLLEPPAATAGVALGIALAALVYGCYGFLIGVLLRRDLEAVFAILVLVNIDAGWLQNPLYFQEARSRWLIEALPAHFPSQTAYLAAFTSDGVGRLLAGSVAYAAVLLAAAAAVYAWRMRVAR
jgi:hypothetical protein